MVEFDTYATNHTRPWMDLVERYEIPEDEAKSIFDRNVRPCMTMEERYQVAVSMIREVEATYSRYLHRG